MSKKNKTLNQLLNESLVEKELQPYQIPDNWVWTKLSNNLKSIQYGYTESASSQEVGPKFLRITDIQNDKVNWGTVPYCKITEKELKKYKLEDDDIVVARTGATTGKSYLINNPPVSVFASYLIRLRCKYNLYPKYLWAFMKSLSYWNQIMVVRKGSTQPGANAKILGNLFIPLPPFDEQKRIADKVERLLTKIEDANQIIEKTKETFELRRAAILDKAFRGELTKDWRKKNTDKSVMLCSSEESGLYGIPSDWAWIKLEKLLSDEKYSLKRGPFGSALKKAYFVSEGYKVYEQKNAIQNDFEAGEYYINDEKFEELKSFEVKPGDIIMSCSGTIGKLAIVPHNAKQGVINQALLKIKLDNKVILNEYFIYLFKSSIINSQVTDSSRGSAIKNIASVKVLKELKVPVPPIKEQEKVIDIIKRNEKRENNLDSLLDEQKVDILKQSILSKAFRGELGTNDITEESAIELLTEALQEQVK